MKRRKNRVSFFLAIVFLGFSIAGNILVAKMKQDHFPKSSIYTVDKQLTPVVNLSSKISTIFKLTPVYLLKSFDVHSPINISFKFKNISFLTLDVFKQVIYEYLIINAP
ncbi:hypothetical protein BH23BAC2_BH23BAC2_26700 [soil metagenome]